MIMKKLLYSLCALSLILVTSCNNSPEKKAENTIKKFIEAVANSDSDKIAELYPNNKLYEAEIDDVVVCETPDDNMENKFPYSSSISQDLVVFGLIQLKDADSLTINSVVVNTLPNDSAAIMAQLDTAALETTHLCVPSQQYPTVCIVNSQYNGHNIIWGVGIPMEGKPVILNTKGLFDPNPSLIEKEFGCSIVIFNGENDNEHKHNAQIACKDLINLKHFERSFNNGDKTTATKYFPKMGQFASFSMKTDSLKLSKYTQRSSNTAIAECDSVLFLVYNDSNTHNEIIECKNLFDYSNLQKSILDEGDEYEDAESIWDIKYIQELFKQLDDIKEKKRKDAVIAKYVAQGGALIKHSFVSGTDSKGISFSVVNLTPSPISYVCIDVVGYNAVDDPVWDDGYMRTLRGIGPVDYLSVGSWSFDNIWKRNPSIVDSYEIKSMTLIFKNGKRKTIKYPELLSEDWKK